MTDGRKKSAAEKFEANRSHQRLVGYRMLGTRTEADDAVQEAWLRLSRSDPDSIDNLGGWLTTVVARVCRNRAASIMERMEHEGVVGQPNHAGKREILLGGEGAENY